MPATGSPALDGLARTARGPLLPQQFARAEHGLHCERGGGRFRQPDVHLAAASASTIKNT
jgi:hypothetical protein